jgi:hypothetical protein
VSKRVVLAQAIRFRLPRQRRAPGFGGQYGRNNVKRLIAAQ